MTSVQAGSHTADLRPRCIASASSDDVHWSGYGSYLNVRWTPDGTSILVGKSCDALSTVSSYIVPHDLLSNPIHHGIKPCATKMSAHPLWATAIAPYFDLSKPSTTLVLKALRSHPVQLTNALNQEGSGVTASYPWVSPTTEEFITPQSLAFTQDGAHFIAGGNAHLACFDINRNGQAPVETYRTGPSKKAKKLYGFTGGIRGIISTLSIGINGVLVAGTLSGDVGLYENEGRGERVTAFSVWNDDTSDDGCPPGFGVTQVEWSPCQRYLYVAQRRSDAILMYDIRVASRRLGWLNGRKADTNQRLAMDVLGNQVWAGGTDGKVRVWTYATEHEGAVDAEWEWQAHEDPVTSVMVHGSASVVVTSAAPDYAPGKEYDDSSRDDESGSNDSGSDDDVSSTTSSKTGSSIAPDSWLKLWAL